MKNKFLFLTKDSLKNKIKTKAFLIVNILLCVLLVSIVNLDSLIKLFGGSESVRIFIDDNYGRFSGFMNDWLNEGVVANLMTVLGNSIFGTLKFLYNLIIGYIISIYILFDNCYLI